MEIHRAQNNQKNLVKVARIILSEFKAKAKAKVIKTVMARGQTQRSTEENLESKNEHLQPTDFWKGC